MTNLSTTQRILCSAVFLTMTIGCTEHPANEPADPADQVLAQEKKGDGPSLQVKPTEQTAPTAEKTTTESASAGEKPGVEVKATEEGVSISARQPVFPGGFAPREEELDPKMVEYHFSRLGPVDLTLSDLPPSADPLEPGRYLLSIVVQLSSGFFNKDQWPCRVEVEGPDVTILLENRNTDPILATLENGQFLADPAEGPGTYGLEGRMVGPGKLRGEIIPGPVDHPRVRMIAGRWGLDSLPLKDPLPSRREEIAQRKAELRAQKEAEEKAKAGE